MVALVRKWRRVRERPLKFDSFMASPQHNCGIEVQDRAGDGGRGGELGGIEFAVGRVRRSARNFFAPSGSARKRVELVVEQVARAGPAPDRWLARATVRNANASCSRGVPPPSRSMRSPSARAASTNCGSFEQHQRLQRRARGLTANDANFAAGGIEAPACSAAATCAARTCTGCGGTAPRLCRARTPAGTRSAPSTTRAAGTASPAGRQACATSNPPVASAESRSISADSRRAGPRASSTLSGSRSRSSREAAERWR